MSYNKIDNKDLTVQVESSKVDVWVPDGLAVPQRSIEQTEFSLIPPDKMAATSLDPETVTVYKSGTEWIYSFGGTQKTPEIFFFATVSGGDGQNARINRRMGRSAGPIITQNRIPIPVQPGSLVKMSGQFKIRQLGEDYREGETKVPLLVTAELYAVGYETDEYGEESDFALKLMSFTQNLQGTSGLFDNIPANLISYVIPDMNYVTVPEGCDRIFICLSYVSAASGAYASVNYNSTTSGWFGSIPPASNYCYLPESNPFRVITEQSDSEHVVVPNTLSSTGAAFKNRSFFNNVFPVFNYLTYSNPGFENNTTGWTGINTGVGDGIDTSIRHSGTKSLKLVGSSQIHDASAEVKDVVPGENYYAEIWVRSDGIYSGAGQIGLAATVTESGINPAYPSFSMINAASVGTTWTLLTGRITIPAGKTKMTVRATVRSEVTGGLYYFDDLKVAKLRHDNEIKIMGTPTTGTEVNIYEWNGTRQSFIANVVCAPNEKKIVDVSSTTGIIEVVKPGQSSPADMAIIKSGNQGPIAKNTWTKITGFRISDSYPGTMLNDHRFQVQVQSIIVVKAYITFGGSGAKYNKGVRILLNGVAQADRTFTTNFETTGMSGLSAAMGVFPGDVIEFQALSDSSDLTQRTIVENTHFELINTKFATAGNDYYIESVLAKEWDDFYQIQDRLKNISFLDVVDEVSSISLERAEADAGTFTINFASATLDPRISSLLQIGKYIRIFGRHYGPGNKVKPEGWSGDALSTTVPVGKVKKINVEYNYKNEPRIVVTAYDVYQRADAVDLGLAYDTIEEYGPAVHCLGEAVYINGIDWSGPSAPMPGELRFFPSTYGDMTLMDSLIMTRNTEKSFVYVDKNNRLIIKDDLDPEVKLIFTDGTLPGDLSMGGVKQGIDTETIVNIIDIEENLLDRSELIERTASSSSPPEKFKSLQGKQRKIRYQDSASVASFGEYPKSFQVVRGTGSYEDIRNDNFGPRFDEWSEDVVKNFSVPNIYISEITSPVKDSDTLRMLLSLDILDKVWVCYQGETYEVNIRSIKQEIKPGKWFFTFKFLPQSDQTYWS